MPEEEKKDEIILKPKEAVEKVPEKPVALQPVEDDKGEIVKLIHTAGTLEFTKEQRKILFAPVVEEDVEIRKDGLIYLPWMEYVTRLRDAFSGKWAIVPIGKPKLQNELILQEYWLLLDGRLYGKTVGEQQYQSTNDTMSWGDAMEGCKSNGLMRLCKGIGISLELWKPTFIRNWKKKYATKEYNTYKGKWGWKKIDPEAKKEPPKRTATPKPVPAKKEEEKKKAPVKVKKETKPEPEEPKEEPKEEETLKPEIVYATDDQKNAIRSLQNTIVDDYGDDAKKLEEKMIAGIKKRFKRTVKDIYEDISEEEAKFLIKSLNLTVQDRHKKLRETEGVEGESL